MPDNEHKEFMEKQRSRRLEAVCQTICQTIIYSVLFISVSYGCVSCDKNMRDQRIHQMDTDLQLEKLKLEINK